MGGRFQAILAEADKAKKGGRGLKKATKKETAKEGPSEAAKPPSKKRKAAVASTATQKRRKQPARKRNEGENSDSETESDIRIEEDPPVRNEEDEPVHTEEHESVRIEEVEQVHNEPPVHTDASSPNREVTPPLNDSVPSPPSSPKTTTSIPITIVPMPPPVSSQASIIIPFIIPIFTESTISHHTNATPASSVHVSDTGANTSGFSSHVTPPISLIRIDDSEMLFGNHEDDYLDGFTYSPFQIRTDSEDEVSTVKRELKSLHEKIDQLLLASQVSTSEAYSKAVVESILE
uniref:Uncharacterized protein n=1 Tax=Lactuca sativa TaxID=4236 RepID=A0A9R1VBG5_LACSA|nr:hypothetical protein LSAT_V11C500245520 [Lactuca sativa]